MNGVTTLYAVPRSDTDNVNYHDQIEIHSPISIFGIEGITIPGGSHGYILKVLEDDVALVRWEVKYLLYSTYLIFFLFPIEKMLARHSCLTKSVACFVSLCPVFNYNDVNTIEKELVVMTENRREKFILLP